MVLVPGGAGGLGAAVTALLLQEGALPVVAYRTNRGRALAFQQKLQDLYGGPVALVEADVDGRGPRAAAWTPPWPSRASSTAWWRSRATRRG